MNVIVVLVYFAGAVHARIWYQKCGRRRRRAVYRRGRRRATPHGRCTDDEDDGCGAMCTGGGEPVMTKTTIILQQGRRLWWCIRAEEESEAVEEQRRGARHDLEHLLPTRSGAPATMTRSPTGTVGGVATKRWRDRVRRPARSGCGGVVSGKIRQWWGRGRPDPERADAASTQFGELPRLHSWSPTRCTGGRPAASSPAQNRSGAEVYRAAVGIEAVADWHRQLVVVPGCTSPPRVPLRRSPTTASASTVRRIGGRRERDDRGMRCVWWEVRDLR